MKGFVYILSTVECCNKPKRHINRLFRALYSVHSIAVTVLTPQVSTFEVGIQIYHPLLPCQRGVHRKHRLWMYNPHVISARKLNLCWMRSKRKARQRWGWKRHDFNCGIIPHGYPFGCDFQITPLGLRAGRCAIHSHIHSPPHSHASGILFSPVSYMNTRN